MWKWMIAVLAVTGVGGHSVPLTQGAGDLPISVRFDTPRDFGYHIGDLIPLTLWIEAEAGTVVDLESLPRPGQAVGLFEVRDVRIDRSRSGSRQRHRIEFTLQTFVPGTWTDGVTFPPLDLRFALLEDRSAEGTYVYRSVTLPPYVVFLSPTAVGPTRLRGGQESVIPRAGWFFLGTTTGGSLLVAAAVLGLTVDLLRWWRRRAAVQGSAAERRALRTLQVLRDRYMACDDKTADFFLKTSRVLRRFLQDECGIPPGAQTVHQIQARFSGHPLEDDVVAVLTRCDRVTYDGHQPTRTEKEALVREATALIDRFEEVGCPVPGGNGAPR